MAKDYTLLWIAGIIGILLLGGKFQLFAFSQTSLRDDRLAIDLGERNFTLIDDFSTGKYNPVLWEKHATSTKPGVILPLQGSHSLSIAIVPESESSGVPNGKGLQMYTETSSTQIPHQEQIYVFPTASIKHYEVAGRVDLITSLSGGGDIGLYSTKGSNSPMLEGDVLTLPTQINGYSVGTLVSKQCVFSVSDVSFVGGRSFSSVFFQIIPLNKEGSSVKFRVNDQEVCQVDNLTGDFYLGFHAIATGGPSNRGGTNSATLWIENPRWKYVDTFTELVDARADAQEFKAVDTGYTEAEKQVALVSIAPNPVEIQELINEGTINTTTANIISISTATNASTSQNTQEQLLTEASQIPEAKQPVSLTTIIIVILLIIGAVFFIRRNN